MADRYYTTFKVVLEAKYDKHIIDILMDFKCRGMSYFDVALETGFHAKTIRKWCYKYSIKFDVPKRRFYRKISAIEKTTFLENFKSKSINIDNILSRRWV